MKMITSFPTILGLAIVVGGQRGAAERQRFGRVAVHCPIWKRCSRAAHPKEHTGFVPAKK